jgi:hypothetical protein
LKSIVLFFAGSLPFTFGMDLNGKNEPSSPHYHALEGQTILHVDWKLAFPPVDLLCYNCKNFCKTTMHLLHNRTQRTSPRGENSFLLSGRIWVYLCSVLQCITSVKAARRVMQQTMVDSCPSYLVMSPRCTQYFQGTPLGNSTWIQTCRIMWTC